MQSAISAPAVQSRDGTRSNGMVDSRRVVVYLAISFGLAWAVSLYLYLTGGLGVDRGTFAGLPVSSVIMALGMMPAPAIAHLLTRVVTGEGWKELKLRPKVRQGWKYWLLAWIATPLLLTVGALLYFLLFPAHFDPSLGALQQVMDNLVAQTGQPLPMPLATLFLIQIIQGALMGPLINAPVILGEEFGWSAYLQPKLLPLGWRPAMILMGVIWGAWHWPIILMGYNYGTDYPGAPWLGPITMLWFSIVAGTFMGWLTLKGKSVWPAVITHGSINALAPAVIYMMQDEPNTLLGPIVTGVIGSLGFAAIAILLMLRQPPELATEMQPVGYEQQAK